MGLTREHVLSVLGVYIRAWEQQDPSLVVSIFTESAQYHERVMDAAIPNREAIRQYWETKVVGGQANITCKLLNLYVDGTTAIAEWEAEFDDLVKGARKRMREVAILEFDGGLIASLREYWASVRVGELSASTADDWP